MLNTLLIIMFTIAIVCISILLIVLLILYVLILSKSFLKASIPADCIIVPGAKIGGLSLTLRIKKAFELYVSGYSKMIIVSGTNDKNDPTITEADYMAKSLIMLSVPSDNIILEPSAFTTVENFKYCKIIMDQNNLKTAIIATNTYHAFRCVSIAKMFDIDFQVEVAPKEKGLFIKPAIREVLVAFRYYILRIR